VTSKTATAIVVTGQLMARAPSASQSATAAPVTITVAADTRFTQIVKATPAALVVGQCARAIGPTDTKGVVAAATITVSAPVNGTCQNGFVGGRGRPGDGGGQPTGGASGA
jgi:ribosomal protein L11